VPKAKQLAPKQDRMPAQPPPWSSSFRALLPGQGRASPPAAQRAAPTAKELGPKRDRMPAQPPPWSSSLRALLPHQGRESQPAAQRAAPRAKDLVRMQDQARAQPPPRAPQQWAPQRRAPQLVHLQPGDVPTWPQMGGGQVQRRDHGSVQSRRRAQPRA
jgi:hypothetical protein